MLGEGFDAELVETHHRRKADAPSGTALMLIEALKKVWFAGRESLCSTDGTEAKGLRAK